MAQLHLREFSSQTSNINLPYSVAILFLGIYPREIKTYLYTKTYIQMWVTSLFIVTKSWKQPKGSTAGEWINKL